MLKNFHKNRWLQFVEKGNFILLFGLIGIVIAGYLFFQYHFSLWMTAIGYPLLAISFAALTIAALSPKSYLHNIKIPGAASMALWSYAIYLVHKPLMVITNTMLLKLNVTNPNLVVFIVMLVSVFSGWLLYFCIEAPVLRFRDKRFKMSFIAGWRRYENFD